MKLTITRTTGSGSKRKVRRLGTMIMLAKQGRTTRSLTARLERSVRRKGSYTFGVVARDAAGNIRAARPLRLRVR